MRRPTVVRSVRALRAVIASWRRKNSTVALVPTMGALHAGHISLVRRARQRADRVVVSIFVNPTQFAPHEDFARYPRDLRSDLAKLAAERVDLVFAPPVREIYPEGFATRVVLGGPAEGLETDFRPHFFVGVATVVSKLLIEVAPDYAVFGEKDYQQLQVVKRLVRDLDLPVRIVGAPIVRERDGLALSSRNAYLSPTERAKAPILYRTLRQVAAAIAAGEPPRQALIAGRRAIRAAGLKLDYLDLRDAETLAPVRSMRSRPLRILVAAHLGATRLIDNLAVRHTKQRTGSR